MKKILLATDKPFAPKAVSQIKSIIEAAGNQMLLIEKYTSVDELLAAVVEADAMIVRSDIVSKQVVDAAPNLKIVVRAGAGYDNIDLQACTEKGVVAMNTPGQNSNAVAELALGMMVYQARTHFNGGSGTRASKGKTLSASMPMEMLDASWPLIAKGFGMKVKAFDPFVSKEAIEADGVTYCE
jgi:D-3-phosphoglycerate dehydrogenase / 2-oxoglutarate reductase